MASFSEEVNQKNNSPLDDLAQEKDAEDVEEEKGSGCVE